MERKILLSFFTIFTILNQIDAQEKAICPIENRTLEHSIFCLPQEYIDEEKNYANLFFTAKKGAPIIAPTDGEVQRFRLSYLYSLSNSKGTDLEVQESYFEQKNKFVKALQGEVNPKFVNATISILTKDGIKYYISGFDPERILKSGEIVKKGQILGYLGYAYNKIPYPSIRISVNLKDKAIDPLLLFGLKSSFIDADEKDYDTKKISITKLKEALFIVRESLEEGHPGLYDYSDKAKLDSIFETIQSNLTSPVTAEEFRCLFKPLFSAIGDSHLSIYGQSKKMPPFPQVLFGLENGKVKTYTATEENQKYLNKEIVEINGEDVRTIIEKLKPYIPGQDGLVESVRNLELMLNMAPIYCEAYNIKAGDSIRYKFSDHTYSKFVCKQLGRDDRYYPMPHYKNENYRFKLYYISNKVAVLRIKTFELLDTDQDSIRNVIYNLVKTQCPNLIIDLRNNKGGDCYDLFGMFACKPYQTQLYSKVKCQEYKFFKYAYNYTPAITNLFQDYKNGHDGFYSINQTFYPVNDSINYNGAVYVLINANSLSASTIFAALFHKYNRGLIIGQETGSAYYQMNAAKFASINLANTGLTMYMPLIKCVFAKTVESGMPWGRGVVPDYLVDIRFEDFFSDNDRIMDLTLDLINKKDE
jgi:hypothetical protein